MRKTLIAIAIGAMALAAAACGPANSSPSTGATAAPLESTSPIESGSPMASPSDVTLPSESPASS
jgi:ABC-type glycerol-3-phosphate transport system substrate-binding protein